MSESYGVEPIPIIWWMVIRSEIGRLSGWYQHSLNGFDGVWKSNSIDLIACPAQFDSDNAPIL
jgi:hypothetical protein